MQRKNCKKRKEKNSSNDFKKEIVVDEAMVEKTILDLRKMRAEQAQHKDHEHVPARPHDVSGAGGKGETHVEIPESEYPAFDDAFAKTFGDFASAEALKEKIRANLKIEKETEQKDKLRLAIVEELLKQSECEIPEILIDSEVEKIFYRLEADITNMGFKFDEYLIQIKKTEEDLRKEWRPEAEKRAKLQMIIQTISEKENLKATEEEIEKEVNNIVTIYKDADPARARAYVEQMLENEKVFAFLEKQ